MAPIFRAKTEDVAPIFPNLPKTWPQSSPIFLGEPDAFPAGDLILRRNAGNLTEKDLLKRAEAWRPWRAYAAMLLWSRG